MAVFFARSRHDERHGGRVRPPLAILPDLPVEEPPHLSLSHAQQLCYRTHPQPLPSELENRLGFLWRHSSWARAWHPSFGHRFPQSGLCFPTMQLLKGDFGRFHGRDEHLPRDLLELAEVLRSVRGEPIRLRVKRCRTEDTGDVPIDHTPSPPSRVFDQLPSGRHGRSRICPVEAGLSRRWHTAYILRLGSRQELRRIDDQATHHQSEIETRRGYRWQPGGMACGPERPGGAKYRASHLRGRNLI